MKHLLQIIMAIILISPFLTAQEITTHYDENRQRFVQLLTYKGQLRDSIVCIVHDRPRRWDRPIITMTRRGEAYDHLIFIYYRKGRARYWSFLPTRKSKKRKVTNKEKRHQQNARRLAQYQHDHGLSGDALPFDAVLPYGDIFPEAAQQYRFTGIVHLPAGDWPALELHEFMKLVQASNALGRVVDRDDLREYFVKVIAPVLRKGDINDGKKQSFEWGRYGTTLPRRIDDADLIDDVK